MTKALQSTELDHLRELLERATPGPWDTDTIHSEGEYGSGPDTTVGFSTYAIFAEHPKGSNKWLTLFDALNSDAGEIVENYPDEDGHVGAWDDVAKANAALIVAAINALPTLLDERDKLLSSLSAANAVVEAGQAILDRMTDSYQARNGRHVGIQGDDGEKCWIVHSDDIEALRAAFLARHQESRDG